MSEGHLNCPFCGGLHWHKYQYLESKLTNIARYITIDERNSSSWGEELADLLVLTGNAVDTFFKDMTCCPYVMESEQYKSCKVDRNRLTINHYKKIFEPFYELSKNSLSSEFGLGSSQSITPFKSFSEDQIPSWWIAYNDTKHEFYSKMENANLGHLLNCLGGLLLLNALHLCSKLYLGYSVRLSRDVPQPFFAFNDLLKSRIGVSRWAGDVKLSTAIFTCQYRVDENITLESSPIFDSEEFFQKITRSGKTLSPPYSFR